MPCTPPHALPLALQLGGDLGGELEVPGDVCGEHPINNGVQHLRALGWGQVHKDVGGLELQHVQEHVQVVVLENTPEVVFQSNVGTDCLHHEGWMETWVQGGRAQDMPG